MNIKKCVQLFAAGLTIYTVGISLSYAFTCTDSTGNIVNSDKGTKIADVYVNLQPSVQPGQNLVVDLSQSISCKNDSPTTRRDLVSMIRGSAFGGALVNFNGSLKYYGINNTFPLVQPTHQQSFPSGNYTPWNTQLFLTPINAAGGIAIKKGSHFATLVMHQVGSDIIGGGNVRTATFTWNLYTNNDVLIPIGGCDVSSRNVIVNLPEYPGTAPVPLSVHCASGQNLYYYLSGTTDTRSNIFANTFSGTNAAKGVGIQLVSNGNAIAVNQKVALGRVTTGAVSLGLSARYGRTSGQVSAGKVQSIIGVTFTYD